MHALQARAITDTGETLLSRAVHIVIRPSNDDFTNAAPIIGSNFLFGRNNAGATIEPGEPNHGDQSAGRSVWYSWTAPGTGRVELDQSGSTYKPVIGVHTGATLTNLILIASNRVGAELPGKAIFAALEGMTYFVAVADFYEGNVLVHLRLFQAPINDHFTNRFLLTGSSLSVTGSTILATKEQGEPASLPGFYSVWWSWSAPGAGAARLRFTGNTYWILGGAFTGNTLSALTPLATLNPSSNPVLFDVRENARYEIALDSFGELDPFVLSLDFIPAPQNDYFTNRVALNGFSVNTTNSNLGASAEPGEPVPYPYAVGGRSVWWSWTAPSTGKAYVRVDDAVFRPIVAVYTGSNISNLTRLAAGDNGTDFRALAGMTYQIAVDGDLGRSGSFSLILQLITPPPNDDFANRIMLRGQRITSTGSNVEATREPLEPDHGQAPWAPGHSSWWSWTAPASGPVSIATESTRIYRTLLAAYAGSALGSLAPVAGNRGLNNVSQISFSAIAGQTYQVAVDGYDGETGDITLMIVGTMPPFLDAQGCRWLNDGSFRVRVSGQTGQRFTLETSPDLVSWTNLTTQSLSATNYDFFDQSGKNFGRRFYRAISMP